MFSRKSLIGMGAAGLLAVIAFSAVQVVAQTASDKAAQATAGKEVALSGRIVDLHCYMTGKMPSEDAAKCTADCIRAGVPAGLETAEGIVVLGNGQKGAAKLVLAHAYQQVTVKGQLFEKSGVKYVDITAVEPEGGEKPGEGTGQPQE